MRGKSGELSSTVVLFMLIDFVVDVWGSPLIQIEVRMSSLCLLAQRSNLPLDTGTVPSEQRAVC
jgi:hypothetical protein